MLWLHWYNLLNPYWLIVAGLFVFRLTSIIHSELIGQPIRYLLGVRTYQMYKEDPHRGKVPDGEPLVTYPRGWWGHLLSCFWCLSVWVSFLAFFLTLVCPEIMIPLAVSALAIIIYQKGT